MMACQISLIPRFPVRYMSEPVAAIRRICVADMQGTLVHMPGNGDIGTVIASSLLITIRSATSISPFLMP